MNIVLHEPEIPQNTGNISRTCAVTGTSLHLVGPLGFSLSDRYLKRAGLDYWNLLDVHKWDNFATLEADYPYHNFYFLSTRGERWYTEVSYGPSDFLVFGSETRGLPAELLNRRREHSFRIPMLPNTRSLNLANTVALVLYEALRQQGFSGLV